MAFISGSFVPTQEYPEWLQTLGDVLPLKHLIDLLRGVYLDGMPIWDAPGSVAVLAAWGAVGAVIAARRFGWEPRER
jgi:ABC-2 type transport system permease protein